MKKIGLLFCFFCIFTSFARADERAQEKCAKAQRDCNVAQNDCAFYRGVAEGARDRAMWNDREDYWIYEKRKTERNKENFCAKAEEKCQRAEDICDRVRYL
jgi:hypothetical protein